MVMFYCSFLGLSLSIKDILYQFNIGHQLLMLISVSPKVKMIEKYSIVRLSNNSQWNKIVVYSTSLSPFPCLNY